MIRIYLGFPLGPEDEPWYETAERLSIEGAFSIISLLLALDILKSIFVNYRSSYQQDSDVLQVKYLIPGCCLLAILVHPEFREWTELYMFMWSTCMYMDGLALMPQVVMMSLNGKVAAPIAHFVAATFLSRVEDFSNTILYYSKGFRHDEGGMPDSQEVGSWRLIVLVQVVQLLLVADFMYYYLKARTSGKYPDTIMQV